MMENWRKGPFFELFQLGIMAVPSFILAGCHACSCISIFGVYYVLLLGSCGPKSDLESVRTCGVYVGLGPA